MKGHTEFPTIVLETTGLDQIGYPRHTSAATMSRSATDDSHRDETTAEGEESTVEQPIVLSRAATEQRSTPSPSKSNLGQPIPTSLMSSTTYQHAGDEDDDQASCSSTRKALGDFHIRSTPPSPTSKSSGPAVPSALKEATDVGTATSIARRRSSSSRLPNAALKRESSILGARPHPHNRSHRENFLIFTRILFKCLSDHPSEKVRVEAKQIIMDCTKRNRLGEPGFNPLIDAIEIRLRHVIGDIHWHKAEQYLGHYMTFRSSKGGGGGGGANAGGDHGKGKDPTVSCR